MQIVVLLLWCRTTRTSNFHDALLLRANFNCRGMQTSWWITWTWNFLHHHEGHFCITWNLFCLSFKLPETGAQAFSESAGAQPSALPGSRVTANITATQRETVSKVGSGSKCKKNSKYELLHILHNLLHIFLHIFFAYFCILCQHFYIHLHVFFCILLSTYRI